MKLCNYVWNIASLGFGRNVEISISRYKEEDIDSLQIMGDTGVSYGCSELMFNIPKFVKELILNTIGFYTIPDFITIAEIDFASYSGQFTFWLFFKGR